jgi:hypothetical protein
MPADPQSKTTAPGSDVVNIAIAISPSSTEWSAVEMAMGEPMTPTGNLRLHSYNPGLTIMLLEREWRGSLGTIWGRVPGRGAH